MDGTSIALDRRITYFAEPISANIAETPDGYWICRNAIIGRSGFQTYKAGEIADPEGLLGDRYRDDEELQLWRDPKEVFSDATISSFEGKSLTLGHPDDLLNPDTDRNHNVGHAQNVRKGTEPLDSGNWPLLADLIVKDRTAIDAIRSGERELSSGYTYKLAREGYRWDQREILGNHVALVPKGRAGPEARINDAAPEKESSMSFLDRIKALGFQAFAKDAKPEDLTKALEELKAPEESPRSIAADAAPKDDKTAAAEFICIGKTKDGVRVFVDKAERAAAHDDDDDKKHGKDDGKEEENKAAMDRTKRLHDALDRLLTDAAKEEEEKKAADDADINKLKELMGKHLEEEKKEPAHQDAANDDKHPEGCRCDDCKHAHDESEGKKAEEEEGKKGADDSDVVRPEPVLAHEDVPRNAFDAVKTMSLLDAFKPIVAKSNDKKVKAAFAVLHDGFKAALKEPSKGTGSYTAFRVAASTASDEAKKSKAKDADEWKPKESPLEAQQKENDAIYATVGKALREKSMPASLKK